MKKTIIVILAAMMALSVVGCGSMKSEPISSVEPSSQNRFTGMTVSVGDTVTFGKYKQNSNPPGGPLGSDEEDIEWIVLAKEGNRVLVISKYALDWQEYHAAYTDVTWETCSLREWLNGTFLEKAFSAEEQNRMISTTVTADRNPEYDTSPGNDTTDKVFLLSITEVNRYFSSDEARKCDQTAYARRLSYKSNTVWWLRSPGSKSGLVAIVDPDGSVRYYGYNVISDGAVRPAMWIDLGD